jgi:hypothetical protein
LPFFRHSDFEFWIFALHSLHAHFRILTRPNCDDFSRFGKLEKKQRLPREKVHVFTLKSVDSIKIPRVFAGFFRRQGPARGSERERRCRDVRDRDSILAADGKVPPAQHDRPAAETKESRFPMNDENLPLKGGGSVSARERPADGRMAGGVLN